MVNLPYRLLTNALRSASMRTSRNLSYFDNTTTSDTNGKNPTLCQEVENKQLQFVLNIPQKARTPENILAYHVKTKIEQGAQENTMNFINLMQIPSGVDLEETKEVLNWWMKLKATEEQQDQEYDVERVRLHGPDSAATHFFVDRQACVKLKDCEDWIDGGRPIMKRCVAGYFVQAERDEKDYIVEAVDCTNFHDNGIRYEGLKYLSGLHFLKKLILKNQKYIDAFCIDRIAGQNGQTLEYLDISGCELDAGCIAALSRMYALRELVIEEPDNNSEVRYNLMLLRKYRPGLTIHVVENPRRQARGSTRSAPIPVVYHPRVRVCRGKTPPTMELKPPFA